MTPRFESIRLLDFRCFESLEFTPGPGRSFVVGRNAMGKTSLLEAICILLRLQSPRTSSLAEAVKVERPAFVIDGRCGGSHLSCTWMEGSRRISLDSKVQTRSDDYLGIARVAWLANSDLDLVLGSSSVRRRFLDFLGTQAVPGYRAALRSYERALRSRNALLKDTRPRREIAAFDEPLTSAGDILLNARSSLTAILAPLAATCCREISGANDHLEIRFRAGADVPMIQALEASRPEEDRLRQTVVGPHRDDILIKLNGLGGSAFASEGQQRSIALALKLAQARHLQNVQGTPPLFLLDDVFGELDPPRRNRLLASLPENAQAIISTTFLDWADIDGSDAIMDLCDGRLAPRLHA